MPTRNVVVTDHQAALIESLVASGRYQNASEVLREGLRLVERREQVHQERLVAFRNAIEEGEAALRERRFTELSGSDDIEAFVRKRGRRG